MNDHMENTEDLVILVDESDHEVGLLEKMSAHEEGLLHRAFSIFIFNSEGLLLLQRRALNKYHSPGLWSNTCCSHPRKGETTLEACSRRLGEEMGLKCHLDFAFSFIYRAEFGNGLVEHEFDHVYFGRTDEIPNSNPDEVMDWKYISINEVQQEVLLHPENYTEWLKICLPKVIVHLED